MSEVRILRQQIPFARSILWAPTHAPRPADATFPVFLRQSALQAMYEHLETTPPPGQGLLGFLLGDRCECPVTGVSYSVIDAALRLNQTIYGDRSLDVVTRLWKRLEGQIEAQQAYLIGWYHTHAPLPVELSTHDVDTHARYFSERWQVGMLVGTDPEAPVGAFFRMSDDPAWVRTPQPFYELLNDDSIRPDGKKRSFITWKTYRAYNSPVVQPKRAGPASDSPSPSPSPSPAPRRSAPHAPPPAAEEVEEPTHRADPAGAGGHEHMPQAELEESPHEPVDASQSSHGAAERAPSAGADERDEAEEEWEDPGALRFLSAAEDAPPPLPSRPAAASPPPPAPPPADASSAPTSDIGPSEDTEWEGAVEEDLVEEPPVEEPLVEEPAPALPERRAARRRASRGGWGRRLRKVGLGLVWVCVLGAAAVAALQYGPGAWRQLSGVVAQWRAGKPSPAPPAAVVPPAPAPPPPPAAAAPVPAPRPRKPEFAALDQADDSLARALQAYSARARLFDRRLLDCMSLGRGMVRLERAAAGYDLQRNATRTLDPDHVARNHDLRVALDSASRQFQQSRCARP